MRTYGRTQDVLTGKKTWHVVVTDANGFNDSVYLTDLAQVCKLNLGESPFFADWGIPAHESVVTQIFPDLYMARIQTRFAPFFASCIVTPAPIEQGDRDSLTLQDGRPAPRYNISVLTHYGARIGIRVRSDYPMEQPI
ncbi:MAG TPA: hypothetical protein VGE97_08690 [Nitrososphaera sp.]|jgi:hypothetical protein